MGRPGRLLFRYVRNVAIAFDRLANALLLGDPEETISTRLGKYMGPKTEDTCIPCRRVARIICWVLGKIDPGHCRDSAVGEEDEGDDAFF